MVKKAVVLLLSLSALLLVFACSTKEEKKMKYYNKGMAFYDKGESIKAVLEFKNALQIDPKFADALHMLGKTELKQQHYKKAFGYFNKAVRLDSGHLDAQVEIARILTAARQTDRAKETVDTILAKDPEHPGGRLVRATILVTEKKYEEAKTILDALHRKGETHPDLFILLAAIYNQQNDPERLEAAIIEGIDKNPDAWNLRLTLAKLYNKTGQLDLAESLLLQNIDMQPQDSSHRLSLADLYWKADQRDKAAEVLDELAILEPDREENTIAAAKFYLQHRELALGEQQLREGIADNPSNFQLREALADLYMLKKNAEGAMATLVDYLAVSNDPADPGILAAKIKMARIYLLRRQLDQANHLVDEVLQENGESVEAKFIKGQLHLAAGRGLDAVTAFRTVVAEAPENIRGYLLLSRAHLMNKDVPLALNALNQGLRQKPSSKDLLKALARVHMTNRDMAAAEAQLIKITSIDPKDPLAMGDLGDIKLSQKQYDAAQQQYNRMVEIAPNLPDGYLKLARLYEIQGRRESAIDILERGYAQKSNSMPLQAALVKIYLAEGMLGRAQKLCDEQIARFPDNAFSYNLLAQVQLSGKDPDAAEAALKAAIQRNPQWNVPHDNLARLYLSQGKTDEAIDNLETAVATASGNNIAAHMTLAHLYELSGQPEKAKQVYEKVLTNDPNHWATANNLAFLMAEHPKSDADLDRALTLAQQADQQRPDDPVVLDTLGWVHYKRGDMEKALILLSDAVEKTPDNGALNYHLGRVLYDSQRFEEAREKLEIAVADDEDFAGKAEAMMLLEKL